MRLPRNKVALGAIAITLIGVGIPALGQQQNKPESLLPPGFGQAAPAPAPSPARPSGTTPATPTRPTVGTPAAPAPAPGIPAPVGANPLNLSILPGDQASSTPTPTPTPTSTPSPDYTAMPAQYELPAFARRSLDRLGVGTGSGTLPADAFGDASGHFVETLMRRLSTPIASRWMHIFLRRTLASPMAAPTGVGGADFAAERAWLLLRMGEPVVARALVQQVDRTDYTAKLLQVAMQTALANGDPGQWCSLTGLADRLAPTEAAWRMAKPICAGLAGYPQQADALMKEARRKRVATGIDLHLAEKVMGAGMRGDQAVTIEWTGVDRLNAWRYGLAAATGVDIPDDLTATVGPQVALWRALSPALDARARAAFAERAAARGVLSSAAMIDLYGEIDMGDNGGTAEDGVARDLRTAYDGSDRDARLNALDKLWSAPDGEQGRYAREVMTAVAAARIAPDDKVKHADMLIASMLSAGFDRAAMRWADHVAADSLGAALLAVADPAASGPIGYGAFKAFAGSDDSAGQRRAQMYAAGLAGLGRLSPGDSERAAKAVGVSLDAQNAWTRALDRAVRARQPATVVLLCAVGMQTPDWARVSPAALYRMVAALNAVGLIGDARMLAAEAVARA